jgi:hypothetical protein
MLELQNSEREKMAELDDLVKQASAKTDELEDIYSQKLELFTIARANKEALIAMETSLKPKRLKFQGYLRAMFMAVPQRPGFYGRLMAGYPRVLDTGQANFQEPQGCTKAWIFLHPTGHLLLPQTGDRQYRQNMTEDTGMLCLSTMAADMQLFMPICQVLQ